METLKVGILEIQGAFLEHKISLLAAAKELSDDVTVDVIGVRNVSHITSDMVGLIIPGGESTAISLFLRRNDMEQPLKDWVKDKHHVTWGTCAGMILLSKVTENQKKGGQYSLEALDVVVSRNYFGRQVNSFEGDLNITDPELLSMQTGNEPFRSVFIRAPAISRTTDPSVKILASASTEDKPEAAIVGCRQGNILATAFHPELTEDTRWHLYFLRMIQRR
ncbi:pyridoxal 5'-phosphate synthase subunit PdxT-like [Haliotis cracherodii]|uniref:pyridoxal 5'-phosphate synthase subunit PdxT-like n=1 Tax=Haliotis cracherodii TaxID=6455 RepID=UPI00201E7B3C|nr:probable pyridoxal 5'-phosphate synthase subunit PDX2 [Haliotis rufescens]XP_046329778.2 probable pyridoxal 5'-phosphate synthase subunit PDX2 [Haliotis rufescens]XP_046329779.2 probable pyridoxal 5'-phosphate synthase subunit PDX2 [Haliotis rufescens]